MRALWEERIEGSCSVVLRTISKVYRLIDLFRIYNHMYYETLLCAMFVSSARELLSKGRIRKIRSAAPRLLESVAQALRIWPLTSSATRSSLSFRSTSHCGRSAPRAVSRTLTVHQKSCSWFSVWMFQMQISEFLVNPTIYFIQPQQR